MIKVRRRLRAFDGGISAVAWCLARRVARAIAGRWTRVGVMQNLSACVLHDDSGQYFQVEMKMDSLERIHFTEQEVSGLRAYSQRQAAVDKSEVVK